MNIPAHDSGAALEVASASPADTLALGRRIAALLRPGDVVLLAGRLGAGKTLMASGIAEGLGVEEPVTSPSFVLVRSYDGLMPVHHADVYRLGSIAEFDDLDLFGETQDGVLLIEWGNAVANGVPRDHLLVELEVAENETRHIRITPHGAFGERSLAELVA
jgi:tRNA threonylcarbamoyladenosine biosynthesis protein TsaE